MSESDWISVDDRYPGDGQEVEVMYSDGGKTLGFYVEPPLGGWFLDVTRDFVDGFTGERPRITKWRPIQHD